MAALIAEVQNNKENTYTTTPIKTINARAPPNFRTQGTPAKTLKHLSKKTFVSQGRVTEKELLFVEEYLETLMTRFTDLTDHETAFGGEYVPALNKDSSNGYDCMVGKDKYFDFESKQIKDSMKVLASEIDKAARTGKYDYNQFICRETFKDELRDMKKVDNPRTFRVMPLGHIWWTKKIFGQLLKHFKDTRRRTGIAVGYNPYLDADSLAKQLLDCDATGDGDFKEWDGKTLAALIRLIMKVLRKYYDGDYVHIIEWLTNTIANSFVLVNDELWATTHGLPSGTWLTLLLNCLINKALTALVIYRSKKDAHVSDVWSVVDHVMGDDKIMGTHKSMTPYFNLLTLKSVSEDLGMKCTNGDKSDIDGPSHPFEKLTFVKRHFRKHPVLQRYVGCLSLDTIFNTLQWVDSTKDTHQAMLGKMRAMQVESYLHSPNLYREFTKIFEKKYPFEAFFSEQKVQMILNSPEGYDEMIHLQGKTFVY